MEIQLNGATREIADAATVGDLLQILDLDLNGVAVAINRNVLPRSDATDQALVKGDKVEIIRAVGGG